ncbi:hypothetical protein, partial [uncultured Caballeronia sp.]|uniref:hypothetical protein n=1 Tax=uncultured Caballeronia sp. TaxID=1827198 RepID=UPI0035C9BE23
MAQTSVREDCGSSDAEAVTDLAALGLIGEAEEAVNRPLCASAAGHRAKMERAVIFGRLAVARKLSGRDVRDSSLVEAITVSREARTPTTYQFGLVAAHDFDFEYVTCDLANDFIRLAKPDDGRKLVEATRDVPTYFSASCLGKLAGTLDQLGKPNEAAAFRHEALDRAIALPNRSERQIALGNVAMGLLETGHLADALKTLRGSGITDFQSDMYAGSIRLGFYRAMAMQEAHEGHYDGAWEAAEAARNDNAGFALWNDLAELLRAMSVAGLPGDARSVIRHVQDLVSQTPPEKVSPILRAALGSTLLTGGDTAGGQAQFDLVAQAADAAVNADQRSYFLQALIRAYAEIGNTPHALELVEANFPQTPKLPGRINRWGALRDIALAAIRREQFDEAVKIAEWANDAELHDLVVHAAALEAANHGQYGEAEHWALKMTTGEASRT